jgi:hypothetical protein
LDQEYQRVVVVTAHGKMEGFQHSFWEFKLLNKVISLSVQ